MSAGAQAVVLYGSRVDLQGTLLDGTGVQLSDEPTAASMADVAATSDGFVVVWAQAESTERGYVPRARRVGADGVPVDAGPVHVLVFEDAIELAITPWENLAQLDPPR